MSDEPVVHRELGITHEHLALVESLALDVLSSRSLKPASVAPLTRVIDNGVLHQIYVELSDQKLVAALGDELIQKIIEHNLDKISLVACFISTDSALLQAARERVDAAGGPSLTELRERFSSWNCPEISGQVVRP